MFEKINIYLDDVRQAPGCFIRTYTVEETIGLIQRHNGNIGIVSLDNDLGEGFEEGRKVVDWIDEQIHTDPNFILPDIIDVHSANGPAGEYMRKTIRKMYLV